MPKPVAHSPYITKTAEEPLAASKLHQQIDSERAHMFGLPLGSLLVCLNCCLEIRWNRSRASANLVDPLCRSPSAMLSLGQNTKMIDSDKTHAKLQFLKTFAPVFAFTRFSQCSPSIFLSLFELKKWGSGWYHDILKTSKNNETSLCRQEFWRSKHPKILS